MRGKLFVVGTPIGNLEDISFRAINTLKEIDFIAAEDTRVSIKLLNHFNIKKPMISYHEHNKHTKGPLICDRIEAGENCAIITDAGMPAISDPGEDLVKLCYERNIGVTVIPGVSAVVSALAISGLDTNKFVFEGFLSVDKKVRKLSLQKLIYEPRTIIIYEAPHKILSTLKDLFTYLGDRQITIVRELTKVHEEVIRTALKESIEIYMKKAPRGEYVLIIAGNKDNNEAQYTLEMAVEMAQKLIQEGNSINQSAKLVAKETNIKKSEIYKKLF